MPPVPLDLRPLFPGERAALLTLLGDLTPQEWDAPTVCPGWSVKDLTAHLLADDLGRISADRDGHHDPGFGLGLDTATFPGLVAAINRQNEHWVHATRRLSPRLLRELLDWSGDATAHTFAALDLDRLGSPVDWAGPEPAPVWLDLARENTERWVHQQQIRDAVGRPGLKEPRWLAPVLATFAHALPRALAPHDAPPGSHVLLVVSGPAGGTWAVTRGPGDWYLTAPAADPAATVTLDQDSTWRLFTNGLTKADAHRRAQISGDPILADAIFDTVAILA